MNIQDRFKKIKTFIFDVDGVLTDGTVLLLENGLQARRMNIKDGYALQLAIKRGYRVMVVSGADESTVTARLHKLGITDIHFGVSDKKDLVGKYIDKHRLAADEVLFMGDDMPDLPVMSVAGMATCPADAVTEIREAARYISPRTGGNGCVRDVIEIVLKLNEHWDYQPGIASR
jgi:3-deoxy-D-manno-octulosonate 8-phosphate phosphatase (KDO 8-P phosphatase)